MAFLLIKTRDGIFDYALRCGSQSPLELVRLPSKYDISGVPLPEPEPVYGLRPMPFPNTLQFALGSGTDAPMCYLNISEVTMVSQEAA